MERVFTPLFHSNMKIGIDFDNTIVCYDNAYKSFIDENQLPPSDEPLKKQVKQHFFKDSESGNLHWTQFQGQLYGKEIIKAQPYDGLINFLAFAQKKQWTIFIISHKSRFPAIGELYDFHDSAKRWLKQNSILNFIPADHCYFLPTLKDKVNKINELQCDLFIDDLPLVLNHSSFPQFTKKILFAPSIIHTKNNSFEILEGWDSIREHVNYISKDIPPIINKPLKAKENSINSERSEEFIEKILISSAETPISSYRKLSGGKNNKTYELTLKSGEKWVAKKYYFSNYDSRNRLQHENSFLKYLEESNIINCPRVIKSNKSAKVGYYTHIEGSPAEQLKQITDIHWEQCIHFLIEIQTNKDSYLAQNLPNAIDSALSLEEHISKLQIRRDRWLTVINNCNGKDLNPSISSFIQSELEPAYQRLASKIISSPMFKRKISREECILSPSDFGLHNAIRSNEDTLYFFDFEYAGWDDPAKTISDFFCQPRIPANPTFFKLMQDQILNTLPQSARAFFLERSPIIYDITCLKWCFILLNEFHPEDSKRRVFAISKTQFSDNIEKQLKKAKALLSRIESPKVALI